MNRRPRAILLCLGVVSCAALSGCGSTPAAKKDNKLQCQFLLPQSRDNIQDYVEYTGRTAAVGSVDVKARVTGFLKEVLFREGAEVKKGDDLFVIDPEPYIAQYDQAQAQVGLYEAQVELTKKTYEQKVATKKTNPNAITDLDLRTTEAQMKEAQASLKAAQASLKIYEINKQYTRVKAPIAGVVGRKNQTPGNVIVQDSTLLTTVVSLDPMYVYFDMDAPTFAKFHDTKPGKGAQEPKSLGSIVLELVQGSQTSEIPGTLDFFNNQFNPATDTLLVRGFFSNPQKTQSAPRLRPGMFVRVRMSLGQPYKALLVPDQAILSKMGKKYVYIADKDNRVKDIPVTIGQLQEKTLRVIRGGQLTATDKVIVSRLLDIQPKQVIEPIPFQSGEDDKGAN